MKGWEKARICNLEQGLVLERLMNLSPVPQRPFKWDFSGNKLIQKQVG